MKECPMNRQGNVNHGNRSQSIIVAPLQRVHLEDLLTVLVEE